MTARQTRETATGAANRTRGSKPAPAPPSVRHRCEGRLHDPSLADPTRLHRRRGLRSRRLPGRDVLIQDGVIGAIGNDLDTSGPDVEIIDARGRLVIPGMIDTHRPVWQGAISGFTPQLTGFGYGPAALTGIGLDHTSEDVYAGTLWGALQALDARWTG